MTSYRFPEKPIAVKATGEVKPFRALKATSTDGVIAQASAVDDPLVGVSGEFGVGSTGGDLSMYYMGICPLEYGDNVAFGDPLTADSDGRLVPAAPGQRFIAIAYEEGDEGTIGSGLIAPGFVPLAGDALKTAFTAAYPPGVDGEVLTSDGDNWGSEALPT